MLVLALAACRARQPVAEAGPGGIVLRCHYLQDQKYALDQDSTRADDWIDQLAWDADAGKSKAYDLFTHRGGGPAGAEWNADGAIVVLASLPMRKSAITEHQLRLNGSPHPFRMIGETDATTQFAYLVSGKQWTSLLRSITPADHALLYPDQPTEQGPGSPIGEGQVLQVEFSCRVAGKALRVVKAFHVAYGE